MSKKDTGKRVRTTHIVESIEPKPSRSLTFAHTEIMDRPCILLRLEAGDVGWFAVSPHYDPASLHRFHTSRIKSVKEDGDDVVVETMNTFYRFRKVDDGIICRPCFDPDRWQDDVKWLEDA